MKFVEMLITRLEKIHKLLIEFERIVSELEREINTLTFIINSISPNILKNTNIDERTYIAILHRDIGGLANYLSSVAHGVGNYLKDLYTTMEKLMVTLEQSKE